MADYNNLNDPMNRPMNDPMGNDYLFVEETVYDTGYDYDPDTKDIKQAVGEAISGIPRRAGPQGRPDRYLQKG